MKQTVALLGIFGAALVAVFAFTASAQDEPAEESAAPAAAEGEAAPAAEAGAAAEAPAVEVKPRAAELMPLTAKSLLLDVVKADGQFVAVGDRGGIITSTDGETWTQAQVPARAALTAVHFPDPNNGWAVGHDATIVRTQDGGKTWTLQNFKPELEKPFLDVLFLDSNRGFAVGAYGLLYATTDGGQTWTEPEAPAIREEELHFNAITKLGNGDLFIAGESGMLGVSADGLNWQRLSSPYDSSLFGALPVGAKGALIFGLRGNAYLTQDVRGGKWTRLETHSVASMFGGTALPGGELAMVGLNGVILITDASGKVRGLQSSTGTPLSTAIAHNGGLLAVGESGVQTIKLN
jgi:photosystem II stability/assembly factor-like uncharacterized protein